MPKGVNVGGMIGHSALRHYTMGERGLDETPATDDDIAAMAELVDEAMAAGALGFSTSRTLLHRVPDGRFVPGTWADERELLAIADVLGRHGKGVYEVAPRFERPGRELRGHAHRDALDGRDQPAHRPAGDVRARAEQRRARAVPRDPRASSTRKPTPAASCGRRRPRAASACCSACNTARSSTGRPSGPRSQPLSLDERLAALETPSGAPSS